jgi:hypothetical protein
LLSGKAPQLAKSGEPNAGPSAPNTAGTPPANAAAPAASGAGDGPAQPTTQHVDESASNSGPALRLFRRGKDVEVDYEFIVYNARLDKTTGDPQLEFQSRLFKDGQLNYSSPVTPLQLTEHRDPIRIGIGGKLNLKKSQEPGRYVLQILITDKLAKEKYRIATQWTDFEVIE